MFDVDTELMFALLKNESVAEVTYLNVRRDSVAKEPLHVLMGITPDGTRELLDYALIAYLATWIISGENTEASFKANLLIQLVLRIVLVFVGRTMVVNFVSDALGTATNSLNSLGS